MRNGEQIKRIGGRRPPIDGRRFSLRLSTSVWAQVERIATDERRPLNTQVEILVERGLRSYGLELSA